MAYPYIAGNPAHMSGPNGDITRIVIHATASSCTPGGARGNASYFQSASAGGLAHYVVDPKEIVQCCHDDTACWHAPPNHGSIGVELCDPQAGSPDRWKDADHQAMLKLAAPLFRELCIKHNVPIRYVDHNGLLAGQRGITTHHEVVLAWHQSDHTDPGVGFPIVQFMSMINGTHTEGYVATLDPDDKKDIIQGVYNLLHADFKVMLHGDATHKASIDAINDKLDLLLGSKGGA